MLFFSENVRKLKLMIKNYFLDLLNICLLTKNNLEIQYCTYTAVYKINKWDRESYGTTRLNVHKPWVVLKSDKRTKWSNSLYIEI